jgi:hypothetical protein
MLRRAEAGEQFTVTVAAGPCPARTHATTTLGQRPRSSPRYGRRLLERFPADVADPFA